jgi:hypothetical protein
VFFTICRSTTVDSEVRRGCRPQPVEEEEGGCGGAGVDREEGPEAECGPNGSFGKVNLFPPSPFNLQSQSFQIVKTIVKNERVLAYIPPIKVKTSPWEANLPP